MHKVFVYGTLRPGFQTLVRIPGRMFQIGWFPGVILGNDPDHVIMAEPVEVDDAQLAALDRYEGFDPARPESSLFVRRQYEDGWIYEYNSTYDARRPIESGDWLLHTGQKEGSNAHLVARR